MKVFFDINVIRTALLGEDKQDDPQYLQDAKAVWKAAEDGRVDAYLAAFSVPMLFTQFEAHYIKYNASKGMDWANGKRLARGSAYREIRRCLEVFFIYDMLHEYLWDADELMSKDIACNDFEDNLQLICSFRSDVDIILTDNVRDFACSGMFGITVLTPSQLLTRI